MSSIGTEIEGSYLAPSLEHATVSDAMRPEMLTCPADAPLRDGRADDGRRARPLRVIVSGGGAGRDRDWGIVSDMDLMRAAREDIDERTASWAAVSEFLSVSPDEPLERAVQMMIEHDVTHLVVVDPGTTRRSASCRRSTSRACWPGAGPSR